MVNKVVYDLSLAVASLVPESENSLDPVLNCDGPDHHLTSQLISTSSLAFPVLFPILGASDIFENCRLEFLLFGDRVSLLLLVRACGGVIVRALRPHFNSKLVRLFHTKVASVDTSRGCPALTFLEKI